MTLKEQRAETEESYEERVERFREEGKDPEEYYAELRAIASRYGKSNGEVFSDVKGSPRSVGSA